MCGLAKKVLDNGLVSWYTIIMMKKRKARKLGVKDVSALEFRDFLKTHPKARPNECFYYNGVTTEWWEGNNVIAWELLDYNSDFPTYRIK